MPPALEGVHFGLSPVNGRAGPLPFWGAGPRCWNGCGLPPPPSRCCWSREGFPSFPPCWFPGGPCDLWSLLCPSAAFRSAACFSRSRRVRKPTCCGFGGGAGFLGGARSVGLDASAGASSPACTRRRSGRLHGLGTALCWRHPLACRLHKEPINSDPQCWYIMKESTMHVDAAGCPQKNQATCS